MACFRTGWKQKVIFLYHMAAATSMSWKIYQFNYHQFSPRVERAGIFIIWAIPSPHIPKQPVPCGGQGCHRSPRAQGAAHSIWQDLEHPSCAGSVPRRLITSDKWHLRTQHRGPRHKDCAESLSHCQSCAVTRTQLQQTLQLSNCTNSSSSCSNLQPTCNCLVCTEWWTFIYLPWLNLKIKVENFMETEKK